MNLANDIHLEASSNGRTADFGSVYEGSNPSASANPAGRPANLRAEIRPLGRPRGVVLVALGAVGPRLLGAAREALGAVLGLAAETRPALMRPEYAFNSERGQYHTNAILRRLSALRPPSRGPALLPVLAVTGVDLFIPDLPFVLGDVDRDAATAIVSTARLEDADQARVARRLAVEAVHEGGHLLGLAHCLDPRCAMFLAKDAWDTDRKEPGLCAGCRAALGLDG